MAGGRFIGLEGTVNVPEGRVMQNKSSVEDSVRLRTDTGPQKKLHTTCWRMEKKFTITNEKWRIRTQGGGNERLTAELDGRKRNPEEIKNLRRAEQELKHTLEEIQDDLCAKDEKITENARLLARKNCDLQEHYITIQDLQQKRKQLEARLKCRQQEQRNLHKETAAETIEEEPTKAESMLKRCATGLWKGIATAGKVPACVALTVGVTVSVVPVFDLVDAAVDLLM
ncbi:uncharacterized protein LOC113745843 [Larimichthys crocea]|uniref:uncharacterized protein LOC113745843 n=1 Tax=Larimichthys crocea TaxID=215358 RepID=UPI000F5EBE95|nr:uncharacterized protein LOC113745843 [Larimichthys crocea]